MNHTLPAPTCLIAEDEPLLAAALRQELAALWPELRVLATVGDGESAVAQALALQPDICFFDIRMPGLGGLEAAQALAEDWPDDGGGHSGNSGTNGGTNSGTNGGSAKPFPLLVFATAYDQYALAAFKAQAVDYLVKPLDRERLAACVQRLHARLAERQRPAAPASAHDDAPLQATLTQLRALLGAAALPTSTQPRLEVIQAQVGNLVHLVPINDVVYFEAADKYVRVVTAAREHLIRTSLRELLPQLDPQAFWQVHRGTVVQARCIATARREESGKVTLSLAGRSEKLVASRLYAHLFKGM
jgi:DNA-binding LytR/AlgR family response regulator